MGPQGGGSRRFQDCHIESAQRFRLRVHARVTMFAVSCTALPHFKSIAENTGDAIVMTPDNRYHVGVPVPVFRINLCRRLPRPDFRLQAHYRILREPPPCGPILVRKCQTGILEDFQFFGSTLGEKNWEKRKSPKSVFLSPPPGRRPRSP